MIQQQTTVHKVQVTSPEIIKIMNDFFISPDIPPNAEVVFDASAQKITIVWTTKADDREFTP